MDKLIYAMNNCSEKYMGMSWNTLVLAISFFISLVVTYWITPGFLCKLRRYNLVGVDVNKADKPKIPEMGGIAAIIGFLVGYMLILSLSEIWMDIKYHSALFAITSIAIIGVLDDIFDVPRIIKAIIPFGFSIPFSITIYYISQSLTIPLLGNVYIGPLMIFMVAFGVTAGANTFNMLEGYNGLGVGNGIIITATLVIISILLDYSNGLFLLLPLLGAMIGFFPYNKYPARTFPGDSLMLFMGATIVSSVAIANLKTIGFFLFLPLILEFCLKASRKFPYEWAGEIKKDGKIHYNGRIFSLYHCLLKKKPMTEKHLVLSLWLIELAVCLIVGVLVII